MFAISAGFRGQHIKTHHGILGAAYQGHRVVNAPAHDVGYRAIFALPDTHASIHLRRLTERSSTAAEQARSAVERSTDIWKQGTRSLTEQTDVLRQLPQVDLGDVTRKYFEYLQDGLEVNKNIALKWFGAFSQVTEAVRSQLQTVTDFQRGHSQAISTWISSETETFENAAKEQAEQVEQVQREQVERAEQAQQQREEQARQEQREREQQARQQQREEAKAEREREEKAQQEQREQAKAQRDEARRVRQEAHERYEGLTKAELSEKLSERDLPKSGNVDELIDRLVSADTN